MSLVGRKVGTVWLVLHSPTRQVVGMYATQEEQHYHISHRAPPPRLAARRTAVRVKRR